MTRVLNSENSGRPLRARLAFNLSGGLVVSMTTFAQFTMAMKSIENNAIAWATWPT